MTISADWKPILDHAREERAEIWRAVCEKSKQVKAVPAQKAAEIGALFIDLRIDFLRAEVAMESGGDMTGIPVDPRPEDTEEGEHPLLTDYIAHHLLVMHEVEKVSGLTDLSFSDPEQEAVYKSAEESLFEAGITTNPLY
jgi:hypothetical protein